MNIRCARDYIQQFLKIADKKGRVIPFRLNGAQERMYAVAKGQMEQGKPVRIIVLKARQLGFSTLVEGMVFADTATRKNVRSLVVAHTEDSTANLFRMAKLFLAELPDCLRPMVKSSNAQEIRFENPDRNQERVRNRPGLRSSIRCVTAGGRGIGRSDTLQNVHCSEYAFWPGDKKATLLGVLQAVPNSPDTMVVIESTANGFDEFKELWDKACTGENDFAPVFFGWHENPEYAMPVPPGTVWTAEEELLAKDYALTPEQLAWRRWSIANNCNGDVDLFRQEYPICPDEAFLASGRPVFDNESLVNLLGHLPDVLEEGEFEYDYDGLTITNIRFRQRKNGWVRIFRKPEKGCPYVLGGDTAGEGSDWFSGHVLDNTTGKQVAVLHHQFDEGEYARQIFCLGTFYNCALVGLENNYSTYPTKELQRLRYPKLFIRRKEDSYLHEAQKSYGVNTNSLTRPVMIAGLAEAVKDDPEILCDRMTIREMMVFAYNAHRRPEALPGEHDDLVMGLAIAHYIRPQQSMVRTAPMKKGVKWSRSMWEDYRAAGPEERAYLKKKWGDPE